MQKPSRDSVLPFPGAAPPWWNLNGLKSGRTRDVIVRFPRERASKRKNGAPRISRNRARKCGNDTPKAGSLNRRIPSGKLSSSTPRQPKNFLKPEASQERTANSATASRKFHRLEPPKLCARTRRKFHRIEAPSFTRTSSANPAEQELQASRKRAAKCSDNNTPNISRNRAAKSPKQNLRFPNSRTKPQTSRLQDARRGGNLRGRLWDGTPEWPRSRGRLDVRFRRSGSRPRGGRTAKNGKPELRPPFPPPRAFHPTYKTSLSLIFSSLMSSPNRPKPRRFFAVKISLRQKPALLDSRPL